MFTIQDGSHLKFKNILNGGYISKTGQFEITIEHEPQKWFYVDSVTLLTILASYLAYLIYTYTKAKTARAVQMATKRVVT